MKLGADAWGELEQRHADRLRPFVSSHLERQARGEKNPVYDFLFEYYSFSPAALMRWTPGLGVVMEGNEARKFLMDEAFREVDGGVALDPSRLPGRRLTGASWILGLLEATSERAPRFGCHGLHEWAMVYRAERVRHAQLPLRLPQDQLAAFVESQPLCCSHYDAYRFFTPDAKPMNHVQLTRPGQLENDQRGCLHVNMDLYKWAYKFHPWVPGHLIADAFLLAVDIRAVDMRASPYDLRASGFAPVAVETPEGRAEYQVLQMGFAARAIHIRARLVECYRALRDLMLGREISTFPGVLK